MIRWRWVVTACVLGACIGLWWADETWASGESYTIAIGRIDPTVQESQECTFPIATGQEQTYIIVHPKSIACVRLRELAGQSIRLHAVIE